jgi:hypothetical protein
MFLAWPDFRERATTSAVTSLGEHADDDHFVRQLGLELRVTMLLSQEFDGI